MKISLSWNGSSLGPDQSIPAPFRSQNPKIVLGLPVYNGENYLRNALDSILSQTLQNFQIIISDNASIDATGAIAREYADRDPRILYYRQPRNIGASRNFNFVFQPGDAPYFKWAAHDDVLEPDYLRSCVELLDQDQNLVMAHSASLKINAKGEKIGTYDADLKLSDNSARARFWRIIWADHFTEIFGVMRSDVVATTKLYGSYIGSDRNLLAELLLWGDLGYVKQHLFCRRKHSASYMDSLKNNRDRLKWFDPDVQIPNMLVGYVKLNEYLSSIARAPLSAAEKLDCLNVLIEWSARRGIESISGNKDQYRHKLYQVEGLKQTSYTPQSSGNFL
ncbi:MAG: glycosyltransferase family 2 protein [Oscillatoriales cyanobacterium RM2_1_1]|nr:glycosyltransferase family 2 protein [Oscillatoriales cyanobacterium SM2_3_0]NJO46635.1 glycosyltransferase family 2 protein [Oscillatoriales cyanobacterium RM2_1_1]